MNRLCFGGSFNPIHHGHLIIARAVAESRGYNKVVLIPSAQPPHKPNSADVAGAEHRLAMCRLAVESSDLFEVDDLELRRDGPSYTIDTARILTGRGYGTVHWLIGGDTLPMLQTWHEPTALLAEIRFITVARPGWQIDWDSLPAGYGKLRQDVVTAPQIEISATDIRRRVAGGKSIEYLTPPAVVEYIRQQGLYQVS